MLINLLCAAFGMALGYRNRANLLYLYLILYPFDGAALSDTGITVFTLISYAVLAPLILYLGYDLLRLEKGEQRSHFAAVALGLGMLYLYIFVRYLVALNPKRDSYFLVLSSGFVLIFGVLYYFRQLRTDIISHIFKLVIVIELGVTVGQALFGAELGRMLGIFDFNQFAPKLILAQDTYRGTGTFQDPNYYALYLAAISSFLLIRFSWLNASVCCLGIVAVLLSFSRMGVLLGAVLCGFLLIRFIRWRTPRKYLGLCFALPLLLAMAIQLWANFPAQVGWGMGQIAGALRARFNDGYDSGVDSRAFIAAAYFQSMLKLSNVLMGLGFLNFQMVLEQVTGVNQVAHNEYIQIFADLGLAGLLLIGLVLYRVFRHCRWRAATFGNPYFGTLVILLLGDLFLSTTLYNYVYFFYALYGAHLLYQPERSDALRDGAGNQSGWEGEPWPGSEGRPGAQPKQRTGAAGS